MYYIQVNFRAPKPQHFDKSCFDKSDLQNQISFSPLMRSLFLPGFHTDPPVSPRPPVMAAVPPVNFVGLGDQGRPRDLHAG